MSKNRLHRHIDILYKTEERKTISTHRLRMYISVNSTFITDAELNEIETKICFNDYKEMEYSGNFIFTKDLIEREIALERLCCGICSEDIYLSNGEVVYFAFDYGH